jgi:hypothetical protein
VSGRFSLCFLVRNGLTRLMPYNLLQLSWSAERRPRSLRVVALDERLAEAARKEGFALVDIEASAVRAASKRRS